MKKYLLLCAAIIFTNAAQAADIYPLDPNHTNITWSANHFGFSSPSGKFTKSTGFIVIDENHPQNSSVSVTIKTDSIMTGISDFDAKLKTKDFFNTIKYPEAKFVSKNIILQGKRAKIIGDLTLLGVTNEITLNAQLNRIGLNSYTQKKTAGFSANAIIKRSDFDMDFGIPGISDNVKIAIEVEGILDRTAKITPIAAENKSLIKDDLFTGKPWRIVTATSYINFAATQNNFTINGSFSDFEGKIAFDPSDLAKSVVSVDVNISSINCSATDSIAVLKNSDWLDLSQFPRANFTATNFTKTPTNEYIAQGNLTIKGRSVPTTVNFILKSYDDAAAVATGYFTIKRSDFGIGNQDPTKANGVQDKIQIRFSLSARK